MHAHTQSMIPAYQTAPGQITSQGDTHTVNDPCLADCTRANRRSGRHAHSQRCLPTRLHEGKLPVRETRIQSMISAYQTAPGLIAGQGDTHTVNDACLADCTRANRRSGRHAHSQRCLPTRLHEGKLPVRETRIQSMISAYQIVPGLIAGQGDTHMHRHTQSTIPAYQTA